MFVSFRKPSRISKVGRKRTSPVWDYFTTVDRDLTECNLCHDSVRCPKSQTSSMISHLQNFHQEEYSQMLQKTSQRVSLILRVRVCSFSSIMLDIFQPQGKG